MPSIHPNKKWFTEMRILLQESWSESITLDEVVKLAMDLDAILGRIRSERGIKPPKMTCRKCGKMQRAAEPRISASATFLAALRFGFASDEQIKPLRKEWSKRRRAGELELYPARLNGP